MLYIKKLLTFFVMLTSFSVTADESFTIKEVDLSVKSKKVEHTKVLNEPIKKIAKTNEYAVFASSRKLWITKDGREFSRIPIDVPNKNDLWFGAMCVAGSKIVIGVSVYPEKLRQKELAPVLGAFRRGPESLGLLIFDGIKASLIDKFVVKSIPEKIKKLYASSPEAYGSFPKRIKPYIQACHWDGNALLIGEYGSLEKIDIDKHEAEILDWDLEMEFSRNALLVDDNSIWVVEDEGGASGGCTYEYNNGGSQRYCILGLNNNVIHVNQLIKFNNRIFSSSLAGLVEIDKDNKRYIHYKISSDRKKMRVYNIRKNGNYIWGLLEDGFIRLDTASKNATKYQLRGEAISNDIYALSKFKNHCFISNDENLYVLKNFNIQ